jgi:NADH-quinone oxidoreductase subunit H
MGMSTIAVLVLAGNVSLSAIITQQQQQGWNVFLLSIAFMVFLISAFAETNRLPFDLPEAESELVGGYHTEYSAMKYSLFMIAEFANMVNASALTVALFFGGWDIPFTDWDNVAPFGLAKTVLTLAAFAAKTLFFLFFFIWIRWTLPRFRYDQLMSLGWKVLLPVMLAYIVLVAGTTLALDAAGVGRTNAIFGLVLFAMNIICVAAFLFFLDRGRLVSPAASRLETQELNRLREVAIRRARLAAETGN